MEEEVTLSAIDDAIRIAKGDVYSGGMWIMLFVFSFLAVMMSIYAQFKKSGKNSFWTPDKFSWSFAIVNNIWRVVVGVMAMYVTFRLGGTLINPAWIANEDLQLAFALAVGFLISLGVDNFIIMLQKRNDILKGPNHYAEAKKEVIETPKNE